MKAYFHSAQAAHHPGHFMANGTRLPNPEAPARIEILCKGAEAAGCAFQAPQDHGQGPIAAVHSVEYLTFLRNIYSRWQRIPDAGPEVIPNIHPANRSDSYPQSAIGQAGFHQADTACPIGPDTWLSAYWSAQTALSAAQAVVEGSSAAYALCRPPGHHAFADLAGGFCFLNNSAIAAQALVARGLRPAVLDIDVHHGNGTQSIFYDRADVLTVSLHADPVRFYPFFWGHAQERGVGAGLGANLNLPLARGTDDSGFRAALVTALARITDFGADVIVVALGVTTPGFRAIAADIAALGLPLVLVQEGGYVSDALGANLTSFLSGISAGPA